MVWPVRQINPPPPPPPRVDKHIPGARHLLSGPTNVNLRHNIHPRVKSFVYTVRESS